MSDATRIDPPRSFDDTEWLRAPEPPPPAISAARPPLLLDPTPVVPYPLNDDAETPLALFRGKTPTTDELDVISSSPAPAPRRRRRTATPVMPRVARHTTPVLRRANPATATPIPVSAATPPRQTPVAIAPALSPDAVVRGWASEAKNRRPWPRPARYAAVGAAGLVALMVGGSRCAPSSSAPSAAELHEDLVVDPDSLRKRREMTADDFRVDVSAAAVPAPPRRARPIPVADAGVPIATAPARLSSRRRTTKRQRHIQDGAERAAVSGEIEDIDVVQGAQPGTKNTKRSNSQAKRQAVRAGDRLRATLRTSLRFEGSARATAVARITSARLRGARLVGSAYAREGGRVTIRFSRLVLPDGREARVHAIAQSGAGGNGLTGSVSRSGASEPSAGSSAARSTGKRALRSALGSGLVGGGADDYLRARDRSGARTRTTTVTVLARGTRFRVLFSEGVRLP